MFYWLVAARSSDRAKADSTPAGHSARMGRSAPSSRGARSLQATHMFELFEHTADLGLRVQSPTLEALLAEAAKGLLTMLIGNPEAIRPTTEKTIMLSAEQPTYLLFDWLSELLYAFETEKLLLSQFEIQLRTDSTGITLKAVCRGEPMDQSRHHMEHEVKAVTYHGLSIEQNSDGWSAQVIVDI
jgi:SHS2 domain-containing protein